MTPKDLKSAADLYVCNMGPEYIMAAENLASELRKNGLRVVVDLTDRKLAGQVKSADKQGAKFVVCVGEDELKSQTFKLKNMADNSEETVSIPELSSRILT